jgi:hypothetical protein
MFFVYEDWTVEPFPRCFYVGKGILNRVKNLRRNKHHMNIVKAHGIDRRVVFASSVEQLTFDVEVKLIAEHKTFVYDLDYVFGANYTRGGEGTSGFRPSQSTRQKMSHSAKTRPSISDETRQRLKNRHVSVCTRVERSNWARARAARQRLEWIQVHDKSITMLSLDGVILRNFTSIKDAAEQTNTSRTMISLVLNGHRASAKGYVWRYVRT